MEQDFKKVEELEKEVKLLKNEVKQTLISIREFLMGIKLPLPAEEVAQEEKQSAYDETPPQFHGNDVSNTQPLQQPLPSLEKPSAGDFAPPEQTEIPPIGPENLEDESSLETPPDVVPPTNEVPPPEEILSPDVEPSLEDTTLQDDTLSSPENSELVEPQADLEQPEEEKMKQEGEMGQPVPQVNQLANLIRWVSAAKKEIGSEQLAAFLEVYSVTGGLSAESKAVIQHVANIVAQQTADPDAVDTWTRLTLELHGILSGGGQPLRLPEIANNEEKVDEVQDNPNGNGAKDNNLVKLKLILPGTNGEEKEFGITLSPDGNGKVH
jgi:hypothetical protein